jgi:UPF0716 protein FxsA
VGALLFLLFLVVPVAELYVIFQVGTNLGWLDTFVALVLISLLGAWLVRRVGLGLLARITTQLGAGNVPTKELVDGALVLGAGALMLTPGFLTDIVGIVFLLPPTRAAIRTVLIRRYRSRLASGQPMSTRVFWAGGTMGGWTGAAPGDSVIDADSSEDWPPRGRLDRPGD